MTILSNRKLWLGLAMLVTSQAALAETEPDISIPFHARVDFNAAGIPTVGTIEGLTPQLASAVRSELARMTIRPGAPTEHAPFHAILNGNVSPTLTNGVAEIQNASFFPVLISNGMDSAAFYPVYPVNRIRRGDEGMAEFFLRIASDGTVIEIKPLRSTHPDFGQSALRAVRNWRYDSATLATETDGIVQIRFLLRGDGHNTPQTDCPLDRSKPFIAGQSGCLGIMEIAGALVVRKP